MGDKKIKQSKAKNNRRWTDLELDCFADVLADPENCFAASLDKLALKRSSNNEVYECIQKELVTEMQTENFKQKNAEYFVGKPTKLDTSVEKLRVKYKWFKTEWASHTRRAKNGSGLAPDKEPHWYQILNPVFAETHQPLNLVSKAADTSFVRDAYGSSSSEEEEEDEDPGSGVDTAVRHDR